MRILNNSEKEFCKCLGLEYQIHTEWGLQYCLLINDGKECSSKAIRASNGQRYHSNEALIYKDEICPKCGTFISLLINHPKE